MGLYVFVLLCRASVAIRCAAVAVAIAILSLLSGTKDKTET